MWRIIVSLVVLIKCCLSSNILAIFPVGAKSQFNMFEPLVVELANRGHNVTVISNYPQEPKVKNLHDIDLSKYVMRTLAVLNMNDFVKDHFNIQRTTTMINAFTNHIKLQTANGLFTSPEVKELISSNQTFDLIVTELFDSDATLAFGERFNAPCVVLSSCAILPWGNDRFGNPDNPSYIPHALSDYTSKMSFWERLDNTLTVGLYKIAYYIYFNPESQKHTDHFFKTGTSLLELARRTSLILVNSHFSIHGARPLVPGFVEVGGMHVKPRKPLPLDIEQFINESENGVIYFSLGSIIRTAALTVEKREAILDALSKLQQRVLWKWEDDKLPGKPENVMVAKWMPQRDILGHPKVELFISHGGLLGTTEAVHSGVPILGIPVFGDQGLNIEAIASQGAGLRLNFNDLNKVTLYEKITEIVNNPKYKKNAKDLSERFHDRAQPPLETAVYWTEYVIRHKGAPHLRSAAVDLPWYQYLLLDVIAFLVVIVFLCFVILYYVFKFIVKQFKRKIRSKSSLKKD